MIRTRISHDCDILLLDPENIVLYELSVGKLPARKRWCELSKATARCAAD
jgi:hypothetical protein